MAKRDQKTCRGEDPRTGQEYTSRTENPPQIQREGPNKHYGGVERGIDPRGLIDPEMQSASYLRQTYAHQSARACRDKCTEKHTCDTQQRMCCHYGLSVLSVGIRTCHWLPSDCPSAFLV